MSARAYRSKRQRPCDQCRERKLGCHTNAGLPCARCHSAGLVCTFAKPPPKRPHRQRNDDGFRESMESSHVYPSIEAESSPWRPPSHYPLSQHNHQQEQHEQQYLHPQGSAAHSHVTTTPVNQTLHSPWPQHLLSFGQTSTQFVQSLDQREGFSVQLFGASAESDPWLLRHCSFDDAGVKSLYKVHFRNAGGVPVPLRIPVHFMIAADDLSADSKLETRAADASIYRREHLNSLVSAEQGQRLVGLFFKYIWPALPLVSRYQLGLTPSCSIPSTAALDKTPVHLLAAIYAAAFPFGAHDDQLCMLHTYNELPVDRLWRMVYEIFVEEIHTPHLATLQAGLLYLHKPLDENRSATADSPFTWSFVGSVVGLACSLGLHIECRMWGIPAWEKRLRRRLWWAVYAEDKWRSLLMGRPPYIRREEWDVSCTDIGDFDVPFRYLIDLTQIAETIHESFYTLRAAQYLSENFTISHDTGLPLLEKLNVWYASLPKSFRLPNWSKSVSGLAPYPASMHFAYLILVVYVYRAMLRPMARSSSPPLIFDIDELPSTTALPMEEASILDFADVPELESFPAVDVDLSEVHGTGETTLNAAERCASIVISFTRRLTSSDFSGFWYSWSRISFATVSNFIVLLLVQAPNAERAVKGKHLVDSWLRVLRCHSLSFPLVKLGLARLDAMHWVGLGQMFALPEHVRNIVLSPDNLED